jgi:hypothetical protein
MSARIVGMGLLVGLLAAQTPAAQPKADSLVKLDAATQEKVRKLQVERRDVLKKVLDMRLRLLKAGKGTIDGPMKASRRLLAAEPELATNAKDRLAAHAAHLEVARQVEKLAKALSDAGVCNPVDYHAAQAARLEAEIGWLRAGGKEKK